VSLAVPYGAVGLLVALRRPANPLGWVFLGLAVSLGLVSASYGYADQVLFGDWEGLPAGELAAWLTGPLFILAVLIVPCFVLLLFPDGRPPSPRWRPVVWFLVVFAAVATLGELAPGELDQYPTVENPLGVGGSAGEVLKGLKVVGEAFLAPLAFLASLASMVVRFRRAGGQERQQVKWVAYAAALMMASFVCSFTFGELLAPFFSDLFFFGGMAGLVGIPIAAGIAILRYRLYDIDVIINRTLVYGALTATLVGAYLAGVLLLQLALGPLTEDNELAIAGSTLAVAALFRPARRRIQEFVDRGFYRRKYDAARTIESFGGRLRDEVDLDAVGGELRTVVSETMQPAHVSLWLRAER
jgi:uncharacterized membrane protein SirB2